MLTTPTPAQHELEMVTLEELVPKDHLLRLIDRVIGYRRPNHRDGYFYKREYVYDRQRDGYVCPNGEFLAYRTTNRLGYREYGSPATQCAACPVKAQCTSSRNGVNVLTRHVWQHYKEAVEANRLSDKGRELYQRRKETVERSFADAKELHGHRYARFRGLAKVRAQALLAAACQNMKKIARLLEQALRSFFALFAQFRNVPQPLNWNRDRFAKNIALFSTPHTAPA